MAGNHIQENATATTDTHNLRISIDNHDVESGNTAEPEKAVVLHNESGLLNVVKYLNPLYFVNSFTYFIFSFLGLGRQKKANQDGETTENGNDTYSGPSTSTHNSEFQKQTLEIISHGPDSKNTSIITDPPNSAPPKPQVTAEAGHLSDTADGTYEHVAESTQVLEDVQKTIDNDSQPSVDVAVPQVVESIEKESTIVESQANDAVDHIIDPQLERQDSLLEDVKTKPKDADYVTDFKNDQVMKIIEDITGGKLEKAETDSVPEETLKTEVSLSILNENQEDLAPPQSRSEDAVTSEEDTCDTSNKEDVVDTIEVNTSPEVEVVTSVEAEVVTSSEAAVSVNAEAEIVTSPEAEAVTNPEVKVSITPEAEVVTNPEAEVSVNAEAEIVTSPEVEVSITPEAEVVTSSEAAVSVNSEAEIVTSPEVETVTSAEAAVVTNPEAAVSVNAEAEIVTSPEAEAVTSAEAAVVTSSEAAVVTNPEVEVSITPEAEVVTNPEVAVSVNAEAEVATSVEAAVVTNLEAEVSVNAEAEIVTSPEVEVSITPEAEVVTSSEAAVSVNSEAEIVTSHEVEVSVTPEAETVTSPEIGQTEAAEIVEQKAQAPSNKKKSAGKKKSKKKRNV